MRNTSSPKLVIATTTELFREFEKRYADKIPVVSGDFTPYWENGACSSARETALNRTAAERLVQAETLSAMFGPRRYPVEQFTEAWRNVILYDEHTWGAYNSIYRAGQAVCEGSVEDQAGVRAGRRRPVAQVVRGRAGRTRTDGQTAGAVDVWNTSAWPRTDLVVLGKELSAAGDVVTGPDGKPVPSQRLSTGELAFLAKDVPGPGRPAIHDRRRQRRLTDGGQAKAEGRRLARRPFRSRSIRPRAPS